MSSGIPDLLASDGERERAAEILRHALSEGRLTVAELEERLSAVYAARHRSQLEPLIADVSTASLQVVPVRGELVRSVTQLDRAIKERRETDETLVNWWLYSLVLSWVTFGIYSVYLYVKRISRIDGFSARKRAYYEALLDWTRASADSRLGGESATARLDGLAQRVGTAYSRELRPIRPALSFVLTLLTAGLYGLWVTYRANRYWWDAQLLEEHVDEGVSEVWTELGIVRYPITIRVDPGKRRSFWLYLVLTIVTFGLWGLVWDYKIHTDPDNLFPEFHGVEDTMLQIVRSQ